MAELYGWGDNGGGQLGVGDMVNRNVPTASGVTGLASLAQSGFYTTHGAAIGDDTTLWVWGNAGGGRLGLGMDFANKPSPVSLGTGWARVATDEDYTLAIKSDGTLWGFGQNAAAQLGLGDWSERIVPTQIGTDTDWVEVSCGSKAVLAIKADGSVWTWGDSVNGALGDYVVTADKTTPYNISPIYVPDGGLTATKAWHGRYHVLILHTDGSLRSCGGNWTGQLGQGYTGSQSDFAWYVGAEPPSAITDWVMAAAGEEHSLGLRSDGTLWAWGGNFYGQLGTGNTTPTNTPVQIGTDTDWAYISADSYQSLGVKTDGTLWAWGRGYYGELGTGVADVTLLSPTQIGTDTGWTQVSASRMWSLGLKNVAQLPSAFWTNFAGQREGA